MHHGELHNVPWDLDDCIMQYKHLSLMLKGGRGFHVESAYYFHVDPA